MSELKCLVTATPPPGCSRDGSGEANVCTASAAELRGSPARGSSISSRQDAHQVVHLSAHQDESGF